MSKVKYNANDMTVEVFNAGEVERALGDMRSKTPQVIKSAVNTTATAAKNLMLKEAKARYAVNAKGREKLNKLKVRSRASAANPAAELYIREFRNDLGYFQHTPTKAYTGRNVFLYSPMYYQAHVLKSTAMEALTGTSSPRKLSKGFLMKFENNGNSHIGMVQRVIGSNSENRVTRSGRPRWKNKDGKVEKLQTMGSPSASAMHHVVWNIVEPDVESILQERLQAEIGKVLARAGR